MQRGQFGQRGITVDGQPVVLSGSTPSFAKKVGNHDAETRVGALGIVAVLLGAFLFLAWLEALLSGTSLITPINQTLLWSMRGLGLLLGGVISILTVLTMDGVPLLKRALVLLVLPFLFAFAVGEIAYRIADWTEFGFSRQAFEEASYPIDSVRHGRKGARNTIRIDPFKTGDPTAIPINVEQYRELRRHRSGCVTVMQRKNVSGAVEIATNGEYAWSRPADVPVGPCGGTPYSGSQGGNPWSKD